MLTVDSEKNSDSDMIVNEGDSDMRMNEDGSDVMMNEVTVK